MKKVFFGFVALSLIMLTTSCNNETVEVNPDLGNMLTFKAATGKQTLTRATEYNISTLEGTGVTVHSYKATDNTLYRVFSVSYDSGTSEWTYGTPVYHPISFDLNHYSVYPESYVNIFNFDSFDCVIETEAISQVDLMVASATSTPDNGLATLVYQHVLSQINFAIQGKAGLTVEINNIELNGINNTGTFTFDAPSMGGTWSSDNNGVPYNYLPALTSVDFGIDDEVVSLNDGTNALMLLPQELDPNANFQFGWTLLNQEDGTPTPIESGISTVNLRDLGVTEWKMGKRYTYRIIFDPVLIVFEVDVDPWEDEVILVPMPESSI